VVAHCTAVHANDGNVFFKTELLIPVPHKTIFKIPVFYIHSHECSGRFADLMQRHEADAIALAQARPVQLDPHEHTVARAVRQPPVLRRAVVGEDRHLRAGRSVCEEEHFALISNSEFRIQNTGGGAPAYACAIRLQAATQP
jgi:hypothetical protein